MMAIHAIMHLETTESITTTRQLLKQHIERTKMPQRAYHHIASLLVHLFTNPMDRCLVVWLISRGR